MSTQIWVGVDAGYLGDGFPNGGVSSGRRAQPVASEQTRRADQTARRSVTA